MGTLTRRIFVGAGASVVLVGGGSLLACGVGDGGTETARYDRLDVLLEAMLDPVRVGEAYRRAIGLDALAGCAIARPHIAHALRIDCPSTRHHILQAGVRGEFAADDVVLCGRFVLSSTECIVAGLRYDRAATAPRRL